MMLECDLELFGRVFLLQTPAEVYMCISSHETRIHRVVQGLQAARPALPS